MIVGITGTPGSGKSELTAVMVQHGWALVDADEIGHEVVEQNPEVLEELRHVFGAEVIGPDRKLDRRVLARRAFAQPEKTQMLNDIVHPRLITCLKRRIEDVRLKNSDVVVDCALIFEWGIEEYFDLVVCVTADKQLRKKRLMERDGRTSEEIEGIFDAQLPESEKIRKADITIKNNDSIEKVTLIGMVLAELPRFYRRNRND